ncbi:Carboxymuconolactone decarboxylase [Mycena sanguinolenta]|uniref:Carboxymuconolactone decarboxylase n=1 Tax=Mycena sanguinolenta TaxID=230812 RepID=A0A8H7DKU7_9AGAR|nr:Carboxymuconolactone decarboxylase [Mycena sanguinolenta]
MSRLIPGRAPAPGVSPIADRIRERRGARGLTPLDQALLHVPPVAEGWNSLLGAIRTKGSLPGDIRELMILRVAARNHAVFEWIHHEPVGRSEGLTTEQLWAIRDTSCLPPPSLLSSLQAAALAFADHSTVSVRVPVDITSALQQQLKPLAEAHNFDVDDLLVEAAAAVAIYNMVSRFLLSVDVAGLSDDPVPWPVDRIEHQVIIGSDHLHAVTLVTHPDAPWIVFANSLLTNETIAAMVAPLPPAEACTMPILANDIALLISRLVPSGKVKSVIGVSQGAAATLAFAGLHPSLTESIVACDTSPTTPPANVKAWQDRIALAKTEGMPALAGVTADRWFPAPSKCGKGGRPRRTHGHSQAYDRNNDHPRLRTWRGRAHDI